MRLARRLCAAVLALTLAPIVVLASGPYPIQSASSTSNDFQTAPQLLSASCATPNYISCPANSTAGVNLVATSLASIAMSGGATMTSQVEISYNGVNFFTVPVFPAGSATSQTTITTDGTYTTPTYGATVIQVRTTSYTSGAETVIIHLATSSVTSSSGSGGGGGGGGGNVTITNPLIGGNVGVNVANTPTVTISGTPTFNCGTGCSAQAPLTGGATGTATGANQAIAIVGYNGATLDALRSFTFNAIPGWLASASTMYDPATALNASVTAAGTNGTNAVSVQGIANGNAMPVSCTSGSLCHTTVDNFPANAGIAQNESGSGQFVTACVKRANITMSSTTITQIVALQTGKAIHVCQATIVGNGSDFVGLVSGTGTNCATTPAVLDGPYFIAAASAGISEGGGMGELFETAASQELCVQTTGTFSGTSIQVGVSYSVF